MEQEVHKLFLEPLLCNNFLINGSYKKMLACDCVWFSVRLFIMLIGVSGVQCGL